MPTGERSGHGRRARRRAGAERPRLGPLAGWAVFAVVVTVGVLALFGATPATLLTVGACAALLGVVLVAAAVLMPPADGPPP